MLMEEIFKVVLNIITFIVLFVCVTTLLLELTVNKIKF